MANFKATYDNASRKDLFFYAIEGMDANSKDQYIADQGVNPENGKSYYSGDISTGPNSGKPSFRSKTNLGDEIIIKRSSGANGKFSWYALRTENSFLNSLVSENPALANTDRGWTMLEDKARGQYLKQFQEEPIEISVSAEGSPDRF
jgi:hypothetical protein